MSMFEVCAKCGHVGRNNYVEKIFAVRAKDAREAARIARAIPRVKHHHKDAIRYVVEVSEERFLEIWEMNANDPYLHCGSIQEQRRTCGEMAVISELGSYSRDRNESDNGDGFGKRLYDGKKAIRNPRKYFRMYERYTA